MKIKQFNFILILFYNLIFLISSSSSPSLKPSLSPSISPSFKPSSLPSYRPSRSPTSIPSIKPTRLPTNIPSIKPTLKPTKRPTYYPTINNCKTITIQMIDYSYNGWSGNYLYISGSQSISNNSIIKLQIANGYYSQYTYLCLPDDVYTVQCCNGYGGYDDVFWSISATSYGVSLSGTASSICEDTIQTFTLKSSNSNSNIE